MVNLTPDSIVFNVSDTELSSAVAGALGLAAEQTLIVCGLEDIDLD